MLDVIIDALLDSIKLLPFLFLTFLVIELFEHKFSEKSKGVIEKSGKFGPVIGSVFGVIPQCGFSVAATNLYVTRIISIGTLFAVYLSTSDEMIPILVAEHAPINLLLKILAFKFILGILFGLLIDFILRKKEKPKYDICDHEHCSCKDNILLASIKHTLSIFAFILVLTLLINLIMHYLGENYLQMIFLKNNLFGAFITSLIGLIPNCAASVIITELYLKGAISFGALIGGLLTGAGLALLVLIKECNKKEALQIIGVLYLIGALSGVLIDIFIKL